MKHKSDRRRCISCGQRFSHFMDTQLFCPACKRQECFCGTFIIRLQALQKISGKTIPCCVVCGEKDLRILVINHKDGRKIEDVDNKNRKVTGRRLYDKILNGERKTDDLNILCYNCNILWEYMNRKTVFFDGKILEKFLKKRGYIKNDDRIFQHFRRKKEKDNKMNLEQVTEDLKEYGKPKKKLKPLESFFQKK